MCKVMCIGYVFVYRICVLYIGYVYVLYSVRFGHRREDKGRRCSFGETKFMQHLAALAVQHPDYMKKRINCTRMI